MEWFAIFAISAIVAILYNWGQPKIFGIASLKGVQQNYFGKTLLTTLVIFAAIVVAGLVVGTFEKA